MQLERKSAAILGATLLVGIVLGLVGQGEFQRARMTRGAGGRPPRFVAQMSDVLQLRADQQASVQPVLEATAEHNQRIIDAARAQLRTIVDSMAITLAPLLDETQRQRLAQRIRELPDPFRPGGPPGGPPPGGPPPGGPPPGGPPR